MRLPTILALPIAAITALVAEAGPSHAEQTRPPDLPVRRAGVEIDHGGIVRGPRDAPRLSLLFTGHEFAEGGEAILDTLRRHEARGSFFLTGDFLRNPAFAGLVRRMIREGHFVGPHSDHHLLYCAWEDRRTLVTREAFERDLEDNRKELERFGVARSSVRYWVPAYEWYNAEIAAWSAAQGVRLLGFTPGTRSNADYTGEADPRFVSSEAILRSILDREKTGTDGLGGFLLLLHVGAGPGRADKMHRRLPELLSALAADRYRFVRVDDLLEGR
jgi:peptidoglycan/xylan/chitin deacetylase (PgdA/CDA1 family)